MVLSKCLKYFVRTSAKMSFVSYIIPHTVRRYSTKYNRDIRVNIEFGKYKLLVNGSRQSGAYIEWLWKKAFRAFEMGSGLRALQGLTPTILVLGVGGGTVIHMLARRFPHAHITAIDIDPKMIEIALSYFGLSKIPNLTLVCADAKKFVEKKARYDLVIVDLFIGAHIPEFVGDIKFLTKLKERGRLIVINYLRELEYEEKSSVLEKRLNSIFERVREYSIARNRFFLALNTSM